MQFIFITNFVQSGIKHVFLHWKLFLPSPLLFMFVILTLPLHSKRERFMIMYVYFFRGFIFKKEEEGARVGIRISFPTTAEKLFFFITIIFIFYIERKETFFLQNHFHIIIIMFLMSKKEKWVRRWRGTKFSCALASIHLIEMCVESSLILFTNFFFSNLIDKVLLAFA